MFDALSVTNAIIYQELGSQSMLKQNGIYLSLDAKRAKCVPNCIRNIFPSVLTKQLVKIDETFLWWKFSEVSEHNKKSISNAPSSPVAGLT